MIMKVFAKGQVVIPAHIRKRLGIGIGEHIEVSLNEPRGIIELSRVRSHEAQALAGSLAGYRRKKSFPDRKAMQEAMAKSLAHD